MTISFAHARKGDRMDDLTINGTAAMVFLIAILVALFVGYGWNIYLERENRKSY